MIECKCCGKHLFSIDTNMAIVCLNTKCNFFGYTISLNPAHYEFDDDFDSHDGNYYDND